jgi:flagellar basal body-associated protein FliL
MDTPPVKQGKAPAKNLWWVLLSALLLLMPAIGAWLRSAERSSAGSSASGTGTKSTLHLETFVVNLSDHEQRSYLRVGIDLGLGRELGKGENPPVALVRDAILGVLAQCRADELLTPQGKDRLKQGLLRTLQERAPALNVQEVYFNEFLIQR